MDQSSIRCTTHSLVESIKITASSHVSFTNLSYQGCSIVFEHSGNITISGSFYENRIFSILFHNVFDSRITASAFDNTHLYIIYNPPPVCYNELHHYSLTLTNVNITNGYLGFDMNHGTSYNISVIIDNFNINSSRGVISSRGFYYSFSQSLFSLFTANSSVSNTLGGFESHLYENQKSKYYCNIKDIESLSIIKMEGCRSHNNWIGLHFTTDIDYFHFNNHHVAIIVKSCSICDNSFRGLFINEGVLTSSIYISVIDTELIGNQGNEIRSISLLNNVTIRNSLSTGLVIIASVVTVENRLVFKNNTGVVGGGMAITDSSVVALSPTANLEFIDNHATYKGGGIYMDESSEFQFKQNSYSIPLTLKDNTAGVAGNDIYGFITSFSYYFDLANPNVSSSHPVMAFFCDPDSNGTISNSTDIYETQNHDEHEQQIFPGQLLKYNVALFLFNFSLDNGTFSPINDVITIEIDKVPVEHVYIDGSCSLMEYTPYKLTYTRHQIALTTYHHKIQSYFIFNECPIGFVENSSGVCDCSRSVSRENMTCDINTLDITHNGLLWIGTYDTGTPFNANETNPNACIINEDCLLYCSPNPVTFHLNDTDTQCVDNRGHRMCGSCTEGYSLLMGSNKCGHCHNNYMMIAWIALFAVMGVLLVVLLIALNLTVSVGTLNGLLFYANIVKLYEPVFSKKGALPVLSQVISWINLDFGIEICFYNGMDSYAKQWLQFGFPLYLWIIIIIIIQLCRRYGKISRLMGSHVVPVLSTLTFLSYTKLIRTIVIVLHKSEVTHYCTDESVRSASLWYEDPNVEYAKGKHAGLFGFALLVSVFFVIPYTLFLLCHPVLEKYLSHFKLFKSWSRFKPIIDAYSGPMKDEYRFWPGLLLVARIPVLLIITFLQNESRVLLLAVAAIILSLSFIFGGVYKKKLNNVIEFWFLLNLCIMASLSIAFTDGNKILIWYNTCLSVFIFSFILIVVYHLYLQLSHIKCYDALTKKLFKKKDEDVTDSHKTVDQQMTEIVPTSTEVRLSDSRGSVVDLF